MPHLRRSAKAALLIIDMINEFTFNDATQLFPAIEQTAKHIADLKREMKARTLPVVYVNDNFGKWQSDFRKLVTRCLHEQCRGKAVTQILLPDEDDYFVLKPKHSGFYATPLELLLRYLEVERLILTGVAGDNCVLFTAADAYMREFEVTVPSDCVISIHADANRSALTHMRVALKAEVDPSTILLTRLAA
jgi:nicotinamidase-related amidase